MGHKLSIVGGTKYWIQTGIQCTAQAGAVCRVQCSEGCETYTYPDHEHGLVNRDICNAVEWMAAWGDLFDCYNGEAGVGLSDGMEISIEWTGDGYLWAPISSKDRSEDK